MSTTLIISCEGQRLTAKISPLQPLQSIIDQVAAKLKPAAAPGDCRLLINGKPADVTLPLRFANLSATAKLEITTGQPSRLGVRGTSSSTVSSDGIARNPETQQSFQTAEPAHTTAESPAGEGAGELGAQPIRPPAQRPAVQPTSAQPERQTTNVSNGVGPSTAQADALTVLSAPVPDRLARLGLDREVVVFTGADLEASVSNRRDDDLPDEFYEFGAEDYAAIMRGYRAAASRAEAGLRTSKMREQDALNLAHRFPASRIRVALPDGCILQMSFRSLDAFSAVQEAVRRCLPDDVPSSSWHLYTTPPKQVVKDAGKTLLELKLCPAAKLYLGGGDGRAVLRAEVLALRSAAPAMPEPAAEPPRASERMPQPGKPQVVQRPDAGSGEAEGRRVPKWLKVSK